MTETKTAVEATMKDYSVRAITDDGAFRVMTVRTTNTVRGIARSQEVEGEEARALSGLISATVLFRETMSPELRVQGILRDRSGLGTFVADSAPKGKTRALWQPPKGESAAQKTQEVLLQMMRTLPSGQVNQGVVRVDSGADITAGMMAYMKDSEQVDTMLAVGTLFDDDGRIMESGGYMIQLLPEVGRGPLALMTERLEDFRNIEHLLNKDFSPEYLRDELLYGLPFTKLDQSGINYDCWCSENRLLAALATLDAGEIQSMIDDGKAVESTCDYCKKEYAIAPVRLRGLLRQN